jgi:hypothetical protein
LILLNGCIGTPSYFTTCTGVCVTTTYVSGFSDITCQNVTADSSGCLTLGGTACPFSVPVGLCDSTLVPDVVYQLCWACTDPILVQWPDAWNVYAAQWFNAFPPAASGQVLIEPASNFGLPVGVGPIVTSPGYSAHVMRLDMDTFAQNTFQIRIYFDRGNLPSACVTGIEVAMITVEPGGLRFIAPLPGESLDLTSYQAPDPHVVCITPDPTAVRSSHWGWIKGMYR